MSASSLATIFMTHLVCPRWLKPEELQVGQIIYHHLSDMFILDRPATRSWPAWPPSWWSTPSSCSLYLPSWWAKMVTITRHQTRNIQAYHTKSNCKQIQVAGVEEITRRRSSQGCVSLARQEVSLLVFSSWNQNCRAISEFSSKDPITSILAGTD